MNGKRCVIISGGPLSNGSILQKETARADFVICADGGARHAQASGIKSNIVVGDFDTLTEAELYLLAKAGAQIIRYPSAKDYSDTHIALLKALELGYRHIDILAATGGRIDHTLANLMLLGLAAEAQARIRIIAEDQLLYVLKKREELDGRCGETISLFPLGDSVTGIRTSGLTYQVKGGILRRDLPIGISNTFAETKAVIEYETGSLLIVRFPMEQQPRAAMDK